MVGSWQGIWWFSSASAVGGLLRTFKDRNKPFISYQILCEMAPSAVYKCLSLWDEDVWMLLTVTIMLFSKIDRRNATSRNSLDPSCQLPVWRWTLLDDSEQDVHIWFTLKYISHATNCNSVHFPSARIRTMVGMVTMWCDSPTALVNDCPTSVQRTGISLWPESSTFCCCCWVFFHVSQIQKK